MKLTEATEADKIKALAELDGYSSFYECAGFITGFGKNKENFICNRYLTSYDAIIPLIQKLNSMQFIAFLCALLPEEEPFKEIHTVNKARAMYFATPLQLSNAVLIATGRMTI